MALAATTVWEVRSTATASNVNGGGFNAAQVSAGTDYSLQDAAQLNLTDLAMTTGGTTLTSATGGFTAAMIGNLIHITAGTHFTAGWYEITARADTNTVTLDRDATDGTNGESGTGYVGGALVTPLDTSIPLDDGHTVYLKGGSGISYAASGAVDISAKDATATAIIAVIGYDTSRSSVPSAANRPTLAMGANVLTIGDFWKVQDVSITGTSTNAIVTGTNALLLRCSVANTSTTASRNGCTTGASARVVGGTYSARNGNALVTGGASSTQGVAFLNSKVGMAPSATAQDICDCIFETCSTAINMDYNGMFCKRNTFRNCTTGIDGAATTGGLFISNTFTDCATPVTWSAEQFTNYWNYNNTYNCGAASNVTEGPNSTVLDPSFTTGTASGTTATTDGAGTAFTATGLLAGVTTSDHLLIKSGTGATAGVYVISSIAGLPDAITIDASAGASATDIVWEIVKGGTATDHSVGTNMRGTGFPAAFIGTGTTSYVDQGAVQRQETLSSSGQPRLAQTGPHKYADLGQTLYYHFAAVDTGGSAVDGATPTCAVRLAGAAVDAVPVYSPTPTLLTHANYPAGYYEVAIAATAANGFAHGSEYAVFGGLTVDAELPQAPIGSFKLAAMPTANLLRDTTVAALDGTNPTYTFTLTDGPDFDNALKDQLVVVLDASNGNYRSSPRRCTAYTGATKTVVLASAPDFNPAVGDRVIAETSVLGSISTQSEYATALLASVVDGTMTLQQALAYAAAGVAGNTTVTPGTTSFTVQNVGGSTTRVSGTYNATTGARTVSTVTPPT